MGGGGGIGTPKGGQGGGGGGEGIAISELGVETKPGSSDARLTTVLVVEVCFDVFKGDEIGGFKVAEVINGGGGGGTGGKGIDSLIF